MMFLTETNLSPGMTNWNKAAEGPCWAMVRTAACSSVHTDPELRSLQSLTEQPPLPED